MLEIVLYVGALWLGTCLTAVAFWVLTCKLIRRRERRRRQRQWL